MIQRQIQINIERQLKLFPAVAVLGPRQVGKTTLVKLLAKNQKKTIHYLDLERSSTFDIVKRDAEGYLSAFMNDCVIIDEIQRMPELFPLLRSLIDEKRKPGRFIISGSAAPELLKGASESLAGRIAYSHLNPIGLHELPKNISMQQHWLRGGFPQHLLLNDNASRYDWMDSFITTYIERDLPFLFDVKFSTVTMRKLWQMLAHLQSGILNAESLGRSLDITGTTLKRYLDYLQGAFIINKLPPFYVNIGKRLVKAPKVYISDSGILHFLLNIHTNKELLSHPSLGASWESYVISQVMYAKNNRTDAFYYRTQAGAECDLVLARGQEVKACIEIKHSKSPVPTKGFYQSMKDLKCKNNFIITSDDTEYTTKEKVKIVGLSVFLKKHLPGLK
ncbi:MAG: ATP-binding protein [Bacteroidetes bacterium]|nr:ATP-binding protein [Bacteroidota bacterium]